VEHAAGGDHSKAAVLELNELAAGKGLLREAIWSVLMLTTMCVK